MSLSATGRPRPLQSKPKPGPFAAHPRRKSTSTSSSPAKRKRSVSADDDATQTRLPAGPVVTTLGTSAHSSILPLLAAIRESMFAPIPERSAGMASTRIAAVLNFRLRLAPLVSVAHLHAASALSRTDVDRAVASLIADGQLRRVVVIGRGRGGAPEGDCLVRVADWEDALGRSGLPDALRGRYLSLLRSTPGATVDAARFAVDEVALLVSAGLMTGTSALAHGVDTVSRAGAFSLGITTPVARAGTTAPTGSHDAVGGREAVHLRGGGSGGLPLGQGKRASGSLTFALPGTGAYLRLVTEARTHLLQLLAKASPKFKESLKEMLRERWDGGIPAEDPASRAKRARGEWAGVLPGKTKKWKSFCGLNFDWILEECLGSGAIECFDTGSVGLGVRAV